MVDASIVGDFWAAVINGALVITSLGVIFTVMGGFIHFAISWSSFMRDWQGHKPKDGRKETVGIVARLENLEEGLKKVKSEVSPNGGKSVKDTVNKINSRLEEGNQMFIDLSARITKIEDKIEL
jgi:ABC-type phosphate transport system auxiliary subunit